MPHILRLWRWRWRWRFWYLSCSYGIWNDGEQVVGDKGSWIVRIRWRRWSDTACNEVALVDSEIRQLVVLELVVLLLERQLHGELRLGFSEFGLERGVEGRQRAVLLLHDGDRRANLRVADLERANVLSRIHERLGGALHLGLHGVVLLLELAVVGAEVLQVVAHLFELVLGVRQVLAEVRALLLGVRARAAQLDHLLLEARLARERLLELLAELALALAQLVDLAEQSLLHRLDVLVARLRVRLHGLEPNRQLGVQAVGLDALVLEVLDPVVEALDLAPQPVALLAHERVRAPQLLELALGLLELEEQLLARLLGLLDRRGPGRQRTVVHRVAAFC